MSTANNHIDMAGKNIIEHIFCNDENIVILLDVNKNMEYLNHAAETYLGGNQKKLLNKNISSYCIGSKLPYPTFLNDPLKKNEQIETITINKDKMTQYFTWRLVPLFKDKNLTGALLFGKDKTQKIKYENSLENIKFQLELFINSIPGYHWWKDLDGKYLGCNNAVAKLLGLNSSQDVVGKTDYELAWSSNADLMTENDRKVIELGETISGEEIVTTQDNTPLTFFVVKMPLKNNLSETIGTIGTSIDITDRKQLEIELKKSKEAAEIANQAKTDFIANMSHDIRTPLSGVVGMSELLEESLVNPEQKQYAHMLYESGEQLLDMLNGILDVVSAEHANENDIKQEAFDLRQCIESIVQLELPTTKLKHLDLQANIETTVPQYIISDRFKIHRILLNLLGNAIKFTKSGKITITVTCLEHKKDKLHLQFAVADTGIGIPKQLIKNVFDRFFRITPSYKGIYSGHGIGLHIAQSYVTLLKGHITLTSQEGVGTTFYFDLPCTEASAIVKNEPSTIKPIVTEPKKSPSPPLPGSKEKQTEPVKPHNAPHLLIIEDNTTALKMAEIMADKAGFHHTSATNGEQALELAQTLCFDLIISDIGLPKMSGNEFTRMFRAWEISKGKNPVPIVGLTAHARNTAAKESLQSGMNDIFTKPITLPMLKSMVSKYVDSFEEMPSVHKTESKQETTSPLGPDLPETEELLFKLEEYPLLDPENAIQSIGNEEMLPGILNMIHDDILASGAEIQQAYTKKDWATIEKLAHKIKGGAVYCGTVRMKYACQYLERYQKAGHTALLDKLYNQLILVLNETRLAIEKWLKK